MQTLGRHWFCSQGIAKTSPRRAQQQQPPPSRQRQRVGAKRTSLGRCAASEQACSDADRAATGQRHSIDNGPRPEESGQRHPGRCAPALSARDCWRSRLAACVLRVLHPAARPPPFRPPESAETRCAQARLGVLLAAMRPVLGVFCRAWQLAPGCSSGSAAREPLLRAKSTARACLRGTARASTLRANAPGAHLPAQWRTAARAWGRRRTTALRPVEASSGSLGAAQALAAAVARSGACARWARRWVPRAALRSLEDARPAGKRSGAAARPMQPAMPVQRAGSDGNAAAGHAAGVAGARRAVRRARRGAGRAAGSGLLSVADRRVPGRPSSPAVSSSCPPAERLGVAAP